VVAAFLSLTSCSVVVGFDDGAAVLAKWRESTVEEST
jgi:hypothetical protein